MPTATSPLSRAINAAKQAMKPQRYGVHDRVFACPLCGHDHFKLGADQGLLGLHTLVCADCTHVEFFETRPAALEP